MEQSTAEPKVHKVAEEYLSSLADLNLNSKPLINMLTILAEENVEHAATIVKVVEEHIAKVNPDVKLPVLYLLDSIVKNVGSEYIQLFGNCIVNIFCGVFEKVNEKVREKMYVLRQTWNDVFTSQKLYTLDVKVNCMDPNWPITAKVVPKSPAIHVNPKFLQNDVDPTDMQAKLQIKQQQLLELQNRKLALELAATKKRLKEQLNLQVEPNVRTNITSIGPGPISGGVGTPGHMMHMQRNMFGAVPKHQNNYGTRTHNINQKITPVNPIMMSSMNKRDPRLARQQMTNLKQLDSTKKTNTTNQTMSLIGIDHSIHPPGTYEERENLLKSDDNRQILNKFKPGQINTNSNLLNKRMSVPSSRKDYNKLSSIDGGKMSSSRSGSRSCGGTSSSNRNGSSKSSSSSPNKYNDKDRNSRRKEKSSVDKKRSNSKEPSKSRDEKSLKSSNSSQSPKCGSVSPKSSQKRHQSRRNLDSITKSPSPTIKSPSRKGGSDTESVEKRLKLTPSVQVPKMIKPNSPPLSSITSVTTSTTEKLDQNVEAATSQDIDLRSFHNAAVKQSLKEEGNKITQSLMEHADEIRFTKKRSSTDNKTEEPVNKKTKSEKIDTLFGSEDVDLRTEITPILSGSVIIAAPPPPNISHENENWEKVKGPKIGNRKNSPIKSSLEDVRAKLAKAAKNNNYSFGKSRKSHLTKTIMSEVQEESQDGTDDNIRTIISQAQELLDSDNINNEQYNKLVQTVIQINETNKLKEAQRRESLLDEKNKIHPDINTTTNKIIAKEPRKRIPKISKNEKANGNVEQTSILKGLESQIPPPSSVTVSNSYSDIPPGREDKEIKRKRQKESKWSSVTPWEQQQQNFNHKNQLLSQKQPWSRSITQTPFQPKNNNMQHSGNATTIPSPWQNPPGIIFANPIQQHIQSASQLVAALTSSAATVSPVQHFSNSVDNPQLDVVRTIPIDGVSKEIRVYDDVAIVFMDWDQPREIGFQNGQRRILIDDQEPISLNFNDDFKTISIKNSIHLIKFGFPSRELYIDKNWYESYFGGPQLSIPLEGKIHVIKIEGPPPQVNIGVLRQDLVVGKINLIVDAHIIIPVFLDAKIQSFELDNAKHTIQFADQLTTVLIDNQAMSVEFGGLPKSVNLGGKKYFIRFGTLPSGIVPGRINIQNMISHNYKKSKDEQIDNSSNDVKTFIKDSEINTIMPTINDANNIEYKNNSDESVKHDLNIKLPLDVEKPSVPAALGNVNIDELFQKLIASGILNNKTTQPENKAEEKIAETSISPIKKEPIVIPIDLSRSETIKTRQAGIVSQLFSGMQCSSCGLRFPPEQTMKYSQHLDWHFRQNRRERDSTRKALSRKWYYDLADWIQYEEIEDIEDREKNWFESQQNDLDNLDDNSNPRCNSPPASCPAGPDDVDRACDVCHEKFEQFYNEDLEEWHLRTAIRIEDLLYHPICYQDFKASLNAIKEPTPPPVDDNSDNDDSVIIVKQERNEDGNNTEELSESFDDDVICVPMEEPSITEILDDEIENSISLMEVESTEKPTEKKTNETTERETEDNHDQDIAMEDDLMIQEPHIPFTDLDTYVERDPEELNAENSNFSEKQFNGNVKIKEEPKDDYEEEEEDAFEDVGTFTGIEIIQDSSDQIIATAIVPDEQDDSNSVHIIETENNDVSTERQTSFVSMDGNIKVSDVPVTSSLGVNKIRINITKNIVSNIEETNKSHSSVSTIPVITTSTTNSSVPELLISKPTNNDSCNNSKGDNNNADKDNRQTAITNTITTTTTTTITKNSTDNVSTSSNKNSVEIPNIEFSFKTELKNVVFKKVDKTESGFETSGLCSIM